MVKLGFTGDVMIGRLMDDVILSEGYEYPWGNTLPFFKENDVNIINLETTLTHHHQKVPKVFNFKAQPDKVHALQAANIHIANLANNHILDFTEYGLKETMATLHAANIKTVGAGVNLAQAIAPAYQQIRDVTLGIIGCTDNEPSWQATEKRSGINYLKVNDMAKIENSIREMRNKADLVIVSIHWGPNNRETPSDEFVNFAHALIDCGVDIIHGHSAHVVQGVEVYQKKLILYDTGDFVDDYAVGPLRNDHTFLFQVLVNKAGIQKLILTPLLIHRFQVNLATGKDYSEMVARIQRLSRAFGTKLIENQGRLELDIFG